MPDLANRNEFEASFARAMERAGRRAFRVLTDAIGDPPQVPSAEVWQAVQNEYSANMMTELEKVYLASLEQLDRTATFNVNWDMANLDAANFAREYSYATTQGMMQSRVAMTQAAIGDFYNRGVTLGQTIDRLSRMFGASAASSIAITETTRASVQAELKQVQALRDAGINLVSIWNTSEDAKVCPICSPLNGQAQGADTWMLPPPAHVSCRCFLSHEVRET